MTSTPKAGEQTVVAQELDDTARAALWPKLVAQYPTVGQYQARAARQIPVFILTRQDLSRQSHRLLPE